MLIHVVTYPQHSFPCQMFLPFCIVLIPQTSFQQISLLLVFVTQCHQCRVKTYKGSEHQNVNMSSLPVQGALVGVVSKAGNLYGVPGSPAHPRKTPALQRNTPILNRKMMILLSKTQSQLKRMTAPHRMTT